MSKDRLELLAWICGMDIGVTISEAARARHSHLHHGQNRPCNCFVTCCRTTEVLSKENCFEDDHSNATALQSEDGR